jgi:hypothetical protein
MLAKDANYQYKSGIPSCQDIAYSSLLGDIKANVAWSVKGISDP